MMASSPPGMGNVPCADQIKAPRRPGLANAETERPDQQGARKASLHSWGVPSVGCSFGDGRGNRGALTEVNRPCKGALRTNSAGHRSLGKVRLKYCWFTFQLKGPILVVFMQIKVDKEVE